MRYRKAAQACSPLVYQKNFLTSWERQTYVSWVRGSAPCSMASCCPNVRMSLKAGGQCGVVGRTQLPSVWMPRAIVEAAVETADHAMAVGSRDASHMGRWPFLYFGWPGA